MDQNVKISCGIYLFRNDNRFLIGHPTGFKNSIWSIPKGRIDKNESNYFEVAKRELLEETGIDYNSLNIIKVEELEMLRIRETNKYLVGFFAKTDSDFSEIIPKCDSMVYRNGVPVFPEFDDFKWATIDESLELLHQFDYPTHLNKCREFLRTHIMTFDKYKK